MKITFLGTGTSHGVPFIGCRCAVCTSLDARDKRLRTSVHLEIGGKSIVIDTGPDFRQQMLRHRIDRVDALVFTHEHRDHTAGLDDIRSLAMRRQAPIPLYASATVLERLRGNFADLMTPPGDHPTLVVPQLMTHEPFHVCGIPFVPIEVLHHKLPVFGFRIYDFTYITDANYISGQEKDKIRGTRTLVVNALQHEPNASHFTVAEAEALIREIRPDKAYLIHISHTLGLHREVEQTLPANVSLAYDGLSVMV